MLTDHIHPEDRTAYELQTAGVLDSAATNELRHRIVRPDGTVRHVYAQVKPQFKEGELVRTTGIIQDVTDRVEAEQLQSEFEALASADRLKNEFISVVSHELRTPLTSIRGALGLLASGVMGALPTPEAQRMVDIAVSSTERLIRLINGILDVERLAAGKVVLALEACDVPGLITTAVEEIRGMANEAGVTVHLAHAEGHVWADPDRVVQTLTNLIGNAIKFSPPGGTVRVLATGATDEVRFEVSDQGRGIPADQLDRIFDRFQQVDASDTREKGGTGLGLAIAKGVVEQHGGRIWAESAPGAGATFLFTLPALATDATVDASPPDEGECRTVLLCDDDAAIRAVVGEMLRSAGYRVMTAGSGTIALEIARAEHPDVILLDLLMPGTDGQQTASALRDDPTTADIPVIILSVLTADEAPVADAAGHLNKPVEGDALLASLRDVLRGSARRVLIVDDDPDVAEVLGAALSGHGFQTAHARTGHEAVALSRHFLPDLVILDLSMPGGDGYSVVESLRHEGRLATVPLVVYTAFDLDAGDRDRLRLGETHFLTKGAISIEALERDVVALIDKVTRQGPG
jgi:signal transduction histidine kinase/CheY-like chemotaxis protein